MCLAEDLTGRSEQSDVALYRRAALAGFDDAAIRDGAGEVLKMCIRDRAMIECVRQKAATFNLPNIRAERRDFVGHGAGVQDRSQAHAMIFNLLHLEQPVTLLLSLIHI